MPGKLYDICKARLDAFVHRASTKIKVFLGSDVRKIPKRSIKICCELNFCLSVPATKLRGIRVECDRRVFLINSTTALTLLGLGFLPASGLAIGGSKSWQQSWFENGKTINETFLALGVGEPSVDKRVVVQAPDTAENGAYVGIGVKALFLT